MSWAPISDFGRKFGLEFIEKVDHYDTDSSSSADRQGGCFTIGTRYFFKK